MALSSSRTGSNPHTFIVFCTAVLLFLLHHFNVIDFQESRLADLKMRFGAPLPARSDIVLLAVDDESLRQIGPWPWSPGIHAVMIEALARYQAKIVYYDVLLSKLDAPDGEYEKLVQALEKSGNVILPMIYLSEEPFQAFFPAEELRETARALGFANAPQDADGILRRIKLALNTPEGAYYSVPVAMVIAQILDEEKVESWVRAVSDDGRIFGDLWIHYPDMDSFQTVSIKDLIEAQADPVLDERLRQMLADRWVLAGLTAQGRAEFKTTPAGDSVPPVKIFAGALDALLAGRFIRGIEPLWRFIIVMSLSFLVSWFTQRLKPRAGFGVFLGIFSGYLVIHWLCFELGSWMLPLSVPGVIMVVSYVMTFILVHLDIRLQGELITRELDIASRILEALLPQEPTRLEQLKITFRCEFAKQIGGDLYDWIELGDGKVGVCVGDVAGKGVPAAIYMARVLSDFRREAKTTDDPAALVGKLNKLLSEKTVEGMFVTLAYVIVDTGRRKITYALAGHEPLILYRAAKKKAELLDGGVGKPAGLFPELDYASAETDFLPGDLLIIYSDGVKETRNPKREQYGCDRLMQYVDTAAPYSGGRKFIDRLFEDLSAFQRGASVKDDRTLLTVKFIPSF